VYIRFVLTCIVIFLCFTDTSPNRTAVAIAEKLPTCSLTQKMTKKKGQKSQATVVVAAVRWTRRSSELWRRCT
jgi:hypothetical protein